jgi:hypothetical protein
MSIVSQFPLLFTHCRQRANNQPDFTLPRTRSIHCIHSIHTRQTIGRFHGAGDSQLAVAGDSAFRSSHKQSCRFYSSRDWKFAFVWLHHGLINYIDTNGKCRHLKKYTCQGTLRQVFRLSEAPSPPMTP